MKSVEKDLKMAKEIATLVNKEGGRVFFVGGYVRDKLLNKENKDIDIEVHGISFYRLKDILMGLGTLDERKVGDHFGVLALNGFDIDIAMPRSERPANEKGNGHKDFIIEVDPFLGFEKAARRRDFTINALMQDVLTGEVLDFFGGQEDLRNKIIRHIDDKTFIEDPLRVFRAAQFAARFDFTIAENTIQVISQMEVTNLSHERIAGELNKALLKAEKPSVFFRELRKMDKLSPWFIEVENLIDVPQEPLHHPEGDVFEHTMMVLDEATAYKDKAERPDFFMVAALCHDFGKPMTTKFDEIKQKITSYDHDKMGVLPVEQFIKRIYNDNHMECYVAEMTKLHMMPIRQVDNQSSQKSFMHLFDKSRHPEELILLVKADNDGRAIKRDFTSYENKLYDYLDIYKELMKKPQVTGNDLICLGLKPGPTFKEILEFSHKVHLAGVDKENALRQIQGLYGRKIEKTDPDKEEDKESYERE